MMELVRKTNSTYNQVNMNLRILADEGIVFDRHLGRMRSIRLNKENLKAQRLLKALRILASQNEDAA
jgi:predicted transcriptional regulator